MFDLELKWLNVMRKAQPCHYFSHCNSSGEEAVRVNLPTSQCSLLRNLTWFEWRWVDFMHLVGDFEIWLSGLVDPWNVVSTDICYENRDSVSTGEQNSVCGKACFFSFFYHRCAYEKSISSFMLNRIVWH